MEAANAPQMEDLMPLPAFGLGALGKFITGAVAHEATREVIKNGLGKAVQVIVKRGEELMQNPRVDYTEVIRRLETVDPAAAGRISDAQQRAADAGVENIFIVALGNYIPHDEAGKIKMEEASERFAWLGGKPERDFNLVVEGLRHDPVAQFIRYWILGNLITAWSFADGAAERLAEGLQPSADRLRRKAAEKPTWRTLWLRW